MKYIQWYSEIYKFFFHEIHSTNFIWELPFSFYVDFNVEKFCVNIFLKLNYFWNQWQYNKFFEIKSWVTLYLSKNIRNSILDLAFRFYIEFIVEKLHALIVKIFLKNQIFLKWMIVWYIYADKKIKWLFYYEMHIKHFIWDLLFSFYANFKVKNYKFHVPKFFL